jgi:hypothetical protein
MSARFRLVLVALTLTGFAVANGGWVPWGG